MCVYTLKLHGEFCGSFMCCGTAGRYEVEEKHFKFDFAVLFFLVCLSLAFSIYIFRNIPFCVMIFLLELMQCQRTV